MSRFPRTKKRCKCTGGRFRGSLRPRFSHHWCVVGRARAPPLVQQPWEQQPRSGAAVVLMAFPVSLSRQGSGHCGRWGFVKSFLKLQSIFRCRLVLPSTSSTSTPCVDDIVDKPGYTLVCPGCNADVDNKLCRHRRCRLNWLPRPFQYWLPGRSLGPEFQAQVARPARILPAATAASAAPVRRQPAAGTSSAIATVTPAVCFGTGGGQTDGSYRGRLGAA